METYKTQVVIVGGAISGSSLACALAHRGIYSILIEKRKNPTDLNRGDGMQPRSLEIMDKWGLLPMFREAGAIEAYGIETHHPLFGKLIEIDMGIVQTPYPYLLNLPHKEIEILLLEHARKSGYCQILYGSVNDVLFEQEQAIGVKATVDGAPVEIYAPVVAAADGAQSAIRRKAGIEVSFHEYDHDLLVLHAQRPSWFNGRLRTRVYMHQQGAVVMLPLGDNRMRMAIMIASGTGGRWKNLSETELRAQMSARLPQLAQLEKLELQGEHIYRMRHMHTGTYARKGIVLLGDSAHVTHASGGLGMNMALQDADTLAEELVEALRGITSFEQAYENYERIRRPINQNVIDRADFMAKQLWTPSWLSFTVRSLSLAIPRYLLPFITKNIVHSLAWKNAGISTPTGDDQRSLGERSFISFFNTLYRFSKGKIGGSHQKNPVLLLTTNLEGKKHTVPLLYFPEGDRLAVIASHSGSDFSPRWWVSLQRDPRAEIQIGANKLSVIASLADQYDRSRLWPLFAEKYSSLNDYQKHTTRQIPIILLQPIGSQLNAKQLATV